MIEEEVERRGERDQERWARERGQKSAQLREIVGLLGEENHELEKFTVDSVPAWTQCVTGTCDVPGV